VEVAKEWTLVETQHPWVQAAAPIKWSDDTHFVIEFIGSQGRVLHSTHDEMSARIQLEKNQVYVRARITYLEMAPRILNGNRARAYYAWTQPVMTKSAPSGQ
jgi:hypothetical protein